MEVFQPARNFPGHCGIFQQPVVGLPTRELHDAVWLRPENRPGQAMVMLSKLLQREGR